MPITNKMGSKGEAAAPIAPRLRALTGVWIGRWLVEGDSAQHCV